MRIPATTLTSALFLAILSSSSAGCGDGDVSVESRDEKFGIITPPPSCASACTTGVTCGTSCTSSSGGRMRYTTCSGAGYACSGGPLGDAVTCYNNGNAPAYTTATDWTQLSTAQQSQITMWLNAAAANWVGAAAYIGEPVYTAAGKGGFYKWLGTPSNPRDVGVAYWNNATNCAYFLSTSDKSAPSASATLYSRWEATKLGAGPLGLPISNPKQRDLVDSYYNTYQQFTNGIVTFRSFDTVAHAVGGADPTQLALATKYEADQGITRSTRPALTAALSTDALCIPLAGASSCSAGQTLGYRAQTYPSSIDGQLRSFLVEDKASVAFTLGGGIGAKYFALPRQYAGTPPWGLVGFPVGDEKCGDLGCSFRVQSFKSANIYSAPSAPGSFVVDSDLLSAYLDEGGPAGHLGMPTEDSHNIGPVRTARTQLFKNGSILTHLGDYTLSPPAPGPSDLFLQRISQSEIDLTWRDNFSTGTSTVYRQVTRPSDSCSPSCPPYVPVAQLIETGVLTDGWADTGAVTNARNCYYVLQDDGAGHQTVSAGSCAYTRDGLNHKPARLRLAMTVGQTYGNGTSNPVFARLQETTGIPSGNITWLETNIDDLITSGTTYAYDLLTFGTIKDLSDITTITVGVAGGDDLCIDNLTLFVDDCGNGNGCGAYRIAYYKNFLADTGSCARASGSDTNGIGGATITVPFQALRSSPDWNYQITSLEKGAPGAGWIAGHFQGFADANATRGFLMGLAANSLHNHDITYNDSHAPIEIYRNTAIPSPGGYLDERLNVKAHIHKVCDAWVQFDVTLTTTCDCVNGVKQIVRTDVGLANAHGEVESFFCQLGTDVLGLLTGVFTAGYYDFKDWLEDLVQRKVMNAIAGKDTNLGAAPPGVHYAVQSNAGFSVGAGTQCDIDLTPSCN